MERHVDERRERSGAAPPTETHLPGLDGLRAVAVAAVVGFHAGVPWLSGGFLGVSVFFTLSGFLITRLLVREDDRTGRIALGAFWSRRFRRLLPAAAAGIVLATTFVVTAGDVAQRATFRGDALSALLYVANWHFIAAGESYAGLTTSPSPVLHYWSLSIEEQFYLAFPLLVVGLLVVARRSRAVLGAALGVLYLASAALPHLGQPGLDRVYYGTFTRGAELLAGALLALVVSAAGRGGRSLADGRGRGPVVALGTASLCVVLASFVVATPTDGWIGDGGLAVYALVSAVLVLAATATAGPLVAVLALRPLQWLGRVSYGVYLYHWPVLLWLAPERTGLGPAGRLAIAVPITLVMAGLSYRYLEQPIRRRTGFGARDLRWAFPVAMAATAAVVVGATLSPPDSTLVASATAPPGALIGDPATLDPPPDSPAEPVGTLPATGPDSPAPTATGFEPKPVVPPSRPLRVLVLGDSTAVHYNLALNAWGEETGVWGTASYARLGCSIGRGGLQRHRGMPIPISDECERWAEEWPAELAAVRPDLVVVSTGVTDLNDRLLEGDDTWRSLGHPVYDDFLRRELTEAMATLGTAGVPVVWLTLPPLNEGQADVPPRTDYAVNDPDRVARYDELLRQVAAGVPPVTVVELGAYIEAWPGGPFDPRLRADGLHLNDEGDGPRVLAAWLGPEILAAYWQAQSQPSG